jgi:hypothetical protein
MATRTTPDVLAGLGQPSDDALGAAMGPQVMALDIAVIRLDGGTQPRAGIDQAVVADYANDMEANGAEFPPVQVVYDGEAYWLWDGFHRLHARKRNGLHTAPAIVRQGTRRDAVLLSVGANATHGFRRTNEDKRRAVMALLADEEWGQWSDREIARRCGVSHPFVADLRSKLSGNDYQMETRRVERNGVEYDMRLPERSAGAAVASQGGKWLSLAELTAQMRGWADVWEEPGTALRGLNSESVGGGGDYWDDWRNWVDGHYSSGMLGEAIKAVLRDVEPAALETNGRERLLAAKAEADAQWEREQAEYRARAAAKPAEQWIVEELVEELVALESVALDGVDQDWLYDYMQGIAARHNRTFGRRDFDTAMRLAIPRQRADNERRERLARAQSQAMAADAERARSETGPSGKGEGGPVVRGREMEFERKQINQGKTVKIYGRNVDGTLTVTVDARTVHLYSPGVTMTSQDAVTLLSMIRTAQQVLFDPEEMSNA